MPKVTSKLQVTLPKKIADAHDIHPGDQIDFESAGDVIRIRLKGAGGGISNQAKSPAERLRLFEEATRRQQAREQSMTLSARSESPDREWTREALYDRVRTD